MEINLSGRAAVVTGGSKGIGLAVATRFAGSGANVAIVARTEESLKEAVAAIKRTAQSNVIGVQADVSKAPDIQRAYDEAMKAFGKVDIIVNNAGIQYVAPIDEFPVAKWDAILAINLSSAFHSTRAALPGMKQRKWGRIVNIASAHGLVASPFKSAYVAAKHGMLGLTKTTALEVAELGITCNAICPGYVWTPLVESQLDVTGGITDNIIRQFIRRYDQEVNNFAEFLRNN